MKNEFKKNILKEKKISIMQSIKKIVTIAMAWMWQCNIALAGPTPSPSASPSPASAEDKWDAVIGFLIPWISRLGGVVVLIGAMEFGLAFKNDDAEGKTKGMRTVIAGLIVIAVGVSSDIFLV